MSKHKQHSQELETKDPFAEQSGDAANADAQDAPTGPQEPEAPPSPEDPAQLAPSDAAVVVTSAVENATPVYRVLEAKEVSYAGKSIKLSVGKKLDLRHYDIGFIDHLTKCGVKLELVG